MGISTAALSGFAQSYLTNRQRQQQQQDELKQALTKAILEQKIKQAMQQQSLIQALGLAGAQGGAGQQMPAYAQGLRETPISPFYLKNPLAENISEMVGYKMPQDIRGEKFQQQAGIYQLAQGIPAPSAGLIRQPQDVIRRSLLARGQRQRLAPQFGGRQYLQDVEGRYKEVKPNVIKEPFTKGKIQSILGELESGGATSIYGYVVPFSNRESAINHALRNLGPNWQQIAPEAKEIIDKKWPVQKTTRPISKLNKRQQTIKYLRDNNEAVTERNIQYVIKQL